MLKVTIQGFLNFDPIVSPWTDTKKKKAFVWWTNRAGRVFFCALLPLRKQINQEESWAFSNEFLKISSLVLSDGTLKMNNLKFKRIGRTFSSIASVRNNREHVDERKFMIELLKTPAFLFDAEFLRIARILNEINF